jgi:anti-anti-sigma factor
LNFDIPNPQEPGYFTVELERKNQVLYLIPKGELDLGSTPAMADALAAAELEGAVRIVVDMALVSFLDCSGLSVVLGAYNRACRDDRELTIVNAQPAVRRMFILTGCKDMLTGTALSDSESIKAPA